MNPRLTLAGIAVAVLVVPALPPALKEKSWRRFFIAAGLSAFGIVVPLFVFGASAFLTPEWKGACPHGWLDCLHLGKLALTPEVLWASAAWYAVEVYRVAQPTRQWIVLGFTMGALVSLVCLVFGFVSTGAGAGAARWWLLVPGYVSVWYGVRAVQLGAAAGLKLAAYVWTVCSSLPFWIASLFWSRYCYQSLPDQPPSCFVVTAAARGHRWLVGPIIAIQGRGCRRLANRQLLTFWRLEAAWRARAPRSHQAFRQLYNRLAPGLARRIASPWAADMTYLLLKPAELAARLALRFEGSWERGPHGAKDGAHRITWKLHTLIETPRVPHVRAHGLQARCVFVRRVRSRGVRGCEANL